MNFEGFFLAILEKGKQEGIHSGFPDPRLRQKHFDSYLSMLSYLSSRTNTDFR